MSYAEVVPCDDVFSWDYWKLLPDLAAVSESYRRGLDNVCIGPGDPTLNAAAARLEPLMEDNCPADVEFQVGDEFIPDNLQVGTVVNYEREFLATCGHPNNYIVHAQLHENSVTKKNLLGVKFKAPSYWNDPEPGMHWAYRHDFETGWGMVLPTSAGKKAVFGLKLSSPLVPELKTAGLGASWNQPAEYSPGLSYEALGLPRHDRCPIGTSTMIAKQTRKEGDPSRATLYRVERVNSVRIWLPARELG
ncbi:MAG TPA: hypothetical protein VG964_02285 [Candidatus Saccharimonadales bacterium]|nr:hypothetical protein [Candidatus Saccharimonadales bacterium]